MEQNTSPAPGGSDTEIKAKLLASKARVAELRITFGELAVKRWHLEGFLGISSPSLSAELAASEMEERAFSTAVERHADAIARLEATREAVS